DRHRRGEDDRGRDALREVRRKAAGPLRLGRGRRVRPRSQRPGLRRVLREARSAGAFRPLLRPQRGPRGPLRPQGGPRNRGRPAQRLGLRRGHLREARATLCGL
ncbi:hypothetical protein AVDCRST_MAG82-1645, partial [uncultured Rubrobacteraceae bacterium]